MVDFNIIIPFTLVSPKWFFYIYVIWSEFCVHSDVPYACFHISYPSWFFPHNSITLLRNTIYEVTHCVIFCVLFYILSSRSRCLQHFVLKHLSLCYSLSLIDQVSYPRVFIMLQNLTWNVRWYVRNFYFCYLSNKKFLFNRPLEPSLEILCFTLNWV
jgi:hypothetical protein